MPTASLADLRSRLSEAYASQHADRGGNEAVALIYWPDMPLQLPPAAGLVVHLGCGCGELVQLVLADRFDAEGVDISPERTALARAADNARVRQGHFCAALARHLARYAAITAIDPLEQSHQAAIPSEYGRDPYSGSSGHPNYKTNQRERCALSGYGIQLPGQMLKLWSARKRYDRQLVAAFPGRAI